MNTSEAGVARDRAFPFSHPADPAGGMSWVVEGGLWLLLIGTPLALGSVSERATLVMEAGCFLLLLLARWGGVPQGSPKIPKVFGVASAVFLLWTACQLIPLPPSLLRIVSPGTHALYVRNLPGYASGRAEDLQAWLLSRREGRSGSLSPRPDHLTGMEGRILVRPHWRPVSWYPNLTVRWAFRFLAYLSTFLLVVRYLPEKAYRKRLPRLLLALGSAISLFGIVQHLTWNGKIYWVIPVYRGGPFGPWVNSNNFSGYMEMVIPIGLAVLFQIVGGKGRRGRRRLSRRSRVPLALLIGFLLFFILAALLMAHSRGGILSILLTTAIFFLLQVARGSEGKVRRWRSLLAGALPLLAVGAGAAWYILHPTVSDPSSTSAIEASFGARVLAWQGVLKMIAANPFTGTGLGSFALAYPLFKAPGMIQNWPQAHNEYLQVLAETGVVGFTIFLAGLFFFLRRFLIPAMSGPWRTREPLILGAALGTTALLIHSLVEFNLQIPSNGLLFVLIAGLLVRSQLEESQGPTVNGPRGSTRADLPKPHA